MPLLLRIVPAGALFLAVTILFLALNTTERTRLQQSAGNFSARGVLMRSDDHPEWREMIIRAAIRRAEELARLRDLPDSPARNAPANESQFAGLPADRANADPEEFTGSIQDMPGTTLPIDIGETSSTELPMRPVEERLPVIKTPERLKLPSESQKRNGRRARQSKSVMPQAPKTLSFFELLFGKSPSETPPKQRSRRGAAEAQRPET